MAYNANNFVIDYVRRITRVNLTTGAVDWSMNNIQNTKVEFTGETTEKTDARGVLINKFQISKGATLSGEGTMLIAPLLASQLGTSVEYASASEAITVKTFESIKVVTSGSTKTATLRNTPVTAPTKVYTLGSDKLIDGEIAIGSGSGEASISGKIITLPDSCTATSVGVLYSYTTNDALKISDGADNYDVAAEYIAEIMAYDVCNPATKRAMTLVFPKATMDNNMSIDLSTDGNHPFTITALQDYCSEGGELCNIIVESSAA